MAEWIGMTEQPHERFPIARGWRRPLPRLERAHGEMHAAPPGL